MPFRRASAPSAAGPSRSLSGPSRRSAPLHGADSRSLGNRLGARLFHSRLDTGKPGDAHESRADAIAGGSEKPSAARAPEGRKSGEPLPAGLRPALEARLGGDLGGVRLHRDAQAQSMSRRLGAEAFTVGGDVYLGEGYQPGSPRGMALLSHELAHALDPSPRPTLRRQPKPGRSAAISARDFFPFQPGARLVANHLLNSTFFGILESKIPDLAAYLRDGQRGTVTAAGDDVFEFRLDNPLSLAERDIKIPFSDESPHIDAVNQGVVTLRLARDAAGEFDFGVFTRQADQKDPVRLAGQSGLAASRKDGALELSMGGQSFLGVERGDAGDVRVSARNPIETEVISLTELPSVPAGGKEEQKAAEAITARMAGGTDARHQRFSIGTGVQWSPVDHPLLTSAWQYSLHPLVGDLFQIPVELQIRYAPPSALMGTLTSGAEVSLASLNIPLNMRFVAGWGAGTLPGDATVADPDPKDKFATGPIVGGGLGLERDWFRFYVRYDHLFNLVDQGPDLNTFHWGVGAAW